VRRACLAAGVLLSAAMLSGSAFTIEGQQVDPPPGSDAFEAPPVRDSTERLPPSSAFLRGVLIPGWGHSVSGSRTRGAFYFTMESAVGWMLFKTVRRIGAAEDRKDFWEDRATGRLLGQGVLPDSIPLLLDADEDVIRARNRVESRKEQREDWLAAGIFILLLSGVDAFVSAHLQDFPEALTIEGDPTEGRVDVSVRVPLAWPGRAN